MKDSLRYVFKSLVMTALLAPLAAQAAIINLSATLGAANQNGSDPALVSDPLGVVPSAASGLIHVQLDTTANTLDFQMEVEGILQSELRAFGPNATPIHLHLAGGDNPGNFGPIAIDLSFNATSANFQDTKNGFTFGRDDVSILLADQGGVQLGMHPGDDQIVDALRSGNAFVLVHTTKDIFLNDTGPVPGFPFGEIRGNLSAVPVPAALPLFVGGLLGLAGVARRR